MRRIVPCGFDRDAILSSSSLSEVDEKLYR